MDDFSISPINVSPISPMSPVFHPDDFAEEKLAGIEDWKVLRDRAVTQGIEGHMTGLWGRAVHVELLKAVVSRPIKAAHMFLDVDGLIDDRLRNLSWLSMLYADGDRAVTSYECNPHAHVVKTLCCLYPDIGGPNDTMPEFIEQVNLHAVACEKAIRALMTEADSEDKTVRLRTCLERSIITSVGERNGLRVTRFLPGPHVDSRGDLVDLPDVLMQCEPPMDREASFVLMLTTPLYEQSYSIYFGVKVKEGTHDLMYYYGAVGVESTPWKNPDSSIHSFEMLVDSVAYMVATKFGDYSHFTIAKVEGWPQLRQEYKVSSLHVDVATSPLASPKKESKWEAKHEVKEPLTSPIAGSLENNPNWHIDYHLGYAYSELKLKLRGELALPMARGREIQTIHRRILEECEEKAEDVFREATRIQRAIESKKRHGLRYARVDLYDGPPEEMTSDTVESLWSEERKDLESRMDRRFFTQLDELEGSRLQTLAEVKRLLFGVMRQTLPNCIKDDLSVAHHIPVSDAGASIDGLDEILERCHEEGSEQGMFLLKLLSVDPARIDLHSSLGLIVFSTRAPYRFFDINRNIERQYSDWETIAGALSSYVGVFHDRVQFVRAIEYTLPSDDLNLNLGTVLRSTSLSRSVSG